MLRGQMSTKAEATEPVESTGGVTVQIAPTPVRRSPKQPAPEKPADDSERRILSLLEQLGGGAAQLHVQRYVEGSPAPRWCCSMPLTEELVGNLEETLARELGGGVYLVRAAKGGVRVGESVRIEIDPALHPPKDARPKQEEKGGGERDAMVLLERMRQEQLERDRLHQLELARIQTEAARARDQQMALMIATMQDNQRLLVEQARAIGGNAGGAGGGIGEISKVAQLLQSFGWAPAAGGAPAATDT